MPAYEAGDFEPPAPIVRAVVRGPGSAAYRDVPLLIDTGADVSVVPLGVATAIGAAVLPADVPVQFYGGDEIRYAQAELTVEFLRYRFRGLFLVADAGYGVLGRNVLSLLVVTLDGPRLDWSA